jgi:hypothetical protein
MLGGYDAKGAIVEDVHCFSLKLGSWAIVRPNVAPEGRAYAAAATVAMMPQLYGHKGYSARIAREGIYIFGGLTKNGILGSLGVFYKYKTQYFYERLATEGTQPCPRYQHSLSYVESRNLLVVYGGKNEQVIQDGHPSSILNDIYVLTLDVLRWIRVEISNGVVLEPKARHAAGIIGDTLYIFGGVNESYVPSARAFAVQLGTEPQIN